jgi:ATP-dependent helicase IRC3
MNVQVNSNIDLRDYQRETLEKTEKAYNDGTNRMLNVQATGMGKSLSFAHLPAWFPDLAQYGMLVVVHTTELAHQAIEEIEWVCPGLKVGLEKAQHEADSDCDVVVTSRQTLGRTGSKRLQRLMKDIPFGIVAVDEAHHVKPSGQYDNILSQLGLGTQDNPSLLPNGKARLSVGWTATPNRNDGIGLHHFYDRVVARYDIRYGITKGFLCDIDARRVDTDSELDDVTTRTGDFAVGELEEETNTPQRNQLIVNAWDQYIEGPALSFCVTQDHARDLAERFRKNGISAKEITAQTPKEEREDLIDKYKRGVIQVLTNVGIFTEGFDAPATQGILMCRPTQSQRLYMQMMGRVTRTEPSDIGNIDTKEDRLRAIESSKKQTGTVVDFVDLTSEDQDIITAPKLFGLSSNFTPEGEDERLVQDTLEEVDELIEKNPYREKDIRQADSLKNMEVMAEEVTVFDLAEISDRIREIADYRWIRVGRDKYRISVPGEIRYHILVEQNQVGQWEITITVPEQRQTVGGEKKVPNHYDDLEDAIGKAEMEIKLNNSDEVDVLKQNAEWHGHRASDAQKKLLDDLDLDYPPDITKGEASQLIDAKKAMMESAE